MSLREPIVEGEGFALAQRLLDNEARVHIELWGPGVEFSIHAEEGRVGVDVSMPHAVWERIRQHAANHAPGEWDEPPPGQEAPPLFAPEDYPGILRRKLAQPILDPRTGKRRELSAEERRAWSGSLRQALVEVDETIDEAGREDVWREVLRCLDRARPASPPPPVTPIRVPARDYARILAVLDEQPPGPGRE